MSGFARRLLAEWRRLSLPAEAGARVLLAVSGGADSTALLLACAELSRAGRLAVRLSVAHLEHGLRGPAGERDARRVRELSQRLGLACVVGRADVGARARDTRDNLEQAARRARYEFLADTAREIQARAVLTAHTLDDQAETVLLRLLRGSGAQGLGGMRPVRPLSAGDEESPEAKSGGSLEGAGAVLLVRPLVRWARRAETESYCRARGVEVSADEMNADERFARVRVRRRLLPLLESFNPRAVEALARTAELLREDAAALEVSARTLLARAADDAAASPSPDENATPRSLDEGADGGRSSLRDGAGALKPLRVEVLARAPSAVRRRALRQWVRQGRGDLRRVEAAHVLAVERLLKGERGGRVAELPGGARVERRRGLLHFREAPGKRVEKG